MAQKQEYLSKNQKIVLDIIEKSAQPMKAYSILFNVKKKGLKKHWFYNVRRKKC